MKEVSVPALVPPATEGNLTDLITNRAHFEPERTMLSRPLGEGWQQVSARTLEAEVRAVAKGLIAAGINAGDRVGLLSRTRYEWTIMDFAIWFAGGVVVPVYETSSAEQIQWILEDSGAVAMVVETPAHAALVESVRTSQLKNIWIITEDALSHLSQSGTGISDDQVTQRQIGRAHV